MAQRNGKNAASAATTDWPHLVASSTYTGNVKMKRVCFRTKRVCFSGGKRGRGFSLSLETRRKSPLVPCSWVY